VLVRFKDVLQNLCGAFRDAASLLGYTGGYRAVYPIKVNQQRGVVEQIVAGGGECVGLEAGSKPELMAVLASAPAGGVIVCNGYKDREYIRLALIGRRLGHAVYIVIEKTANWTSYLRSLSTWVSNRCSGCGCVLRPWRRVNGGTRVGPSRSSVFPQRRCLPWSRASGQVTACTG